MHSHDFGMPAEDPSAPHERQEALHSLTHYLESQRARFESVEARSVEGEDSAEREEMQSTVDTALLKWHAGLWYRSQ